jgi:vitamin B12 transporter
LLKHCSSSLTVRITVLTLLLSSLPLWAASLASEDKLSTVVVTATRTEQPLEESLVSLTVLTRQDIERLQVNSLQALLAGQAGINIVNSGGLGKVTSVFLRGTEADHVLVLIDGVRIGSPTSGSAALQDLPIEQIDHIEIARGPLSALYGSEALGGVIQIFTRRGGGELKSQASLGAGSFGTSRASLGLSGGGQRAWWNADFSSLESEGINACLGLGVPPYGGCFTDEPDRDGYRKKSGALRAGVALTPTLALEAFALRAQGRTEYDGSFGNIADFLQQALGASARWSPSAAWQIAAQVGRATDNASNFQEVVAQDRFNTHRDTLSVQSDYAWGGGRHLTFGIDRTADRVDSTVLYDIDSRHTVGAFAQLQARLGAHDLVFGLRQDDNSDFGNKTTGNVGWGLRVNDAWRVTARAGTGFKAPSFNELYYPFFGNPNLRPETSKSVELGLRYVHSTVRGSLSLFENRIDDLIGFNDFFETVNIDRTRIRGAELTLDTRWRSADIKLALTALDPINRSEGALKGNALPRRARQTARLDLTREIGPVQIGMVVNASGARFDNLANTQRLAAYTTVDLQGSVRIGRDWRAELRAGNVFDHAYQTAAYYPQFGRDLFASLRYAPTK